MLKPLDRIRSCGMVRAAVIGFHCRHARRSGCSVGCRHCLGHSVINSEDIFCPFSCPPCFLHECYDRTKGTDVSDTKYNTIEFLKASRQVFHTKLQLHHKCGTAKLQHGDSYVSSPQRHTILH